MATVENRTDDQLLASSTLTQPVYEIGEPELEPVVAPSQPDLKDDELDFFNEFYGALESTIFTDNPRLAGRAIEGMGRVTGIDSMREFGDSVVAEYESSPDKEQFVPKVSTYKDVDGLNSAMNYIGSTVGQGLGSISVTIAGAGAGALTGAAVGSVVPGAGTMAGAKVGATAGSLGSGFLLNYGDTYEYLMEQQGMDPDDAAKYAVVPGAIMGALEAYGVGKLLGAATKRDLSKNIIKRTGQLALRGAGTEAVTEAGQQIVQESAGELSELTGHARNDIEFQQRFDNIVNSFIAGGLTGGTVGGATAPFRKPTEAPPPSDVETAAVEVEAPIEDVSASVEAAAEVAQEEKQTQVAQSPSFETIEDFEAQREVEAPIEDVVDPEDLMMERRQDYYEGTADLRGDPLDLDRPEPPSPEEMQLELEELARFEGLKTIPEAMERKAEIESDFGSIEAYEAQRERERLVEIDQPDQTLQPQKYELHSFDPDYTPPSMSKDNPKPLSRNEYNSLREQLDINKNDPRFNYGGEIRNGFPEGHRYAEKRINQPNLMENPDFDQSATKVYSETGLKGFRALIGRIESGPRGHVDFWASDDIDLAIGQGGRGYMLEIDPRLVNGFQADTKAPMMAFQASGFLKGSEYKITQSVRGAVTALIFRNPRQIQAVLRGAGQPGRSNNLATYLSNAFDFENPIEFEFMRQGQSENVKGLRVPRKIQRLSPVETDPDADSDADPKPPVILQQSPANVVQELTDEAQVEGIQKLQSIIRDLPDDAVQAYDELSNRYKDVIGRGILNEVGFKTRSIKLDAEPQDKTSSRNLRLVSENYESLLRGLISPEQYRFQKYIIENQDARDAYSLANPDHPYFRIHLRYATNEFLELIIDAQQQAKELGLSGVTVDDIYSGRFADAIIGAGGSARRFTYRNKRVRRLFQEAQQQLDELGIDYKIKVEPPTKLMVARHLFTKFRRHLYRSAKEGTPIPPLPKIDVLIDQVPRKRASFDEMGAGEQRDFSRSSPESNLEITLEDLFEGVQEQSTMGVSQPRDLAEFVKSRPGEELKWYEKAEQAPRGSGAIMSVVGQTSSKLDAAWQQDDGVATIREFEADVVKEFVNMVGPDRLQNIAFAIEPKIRTGMMLNEPLGLYFFGKDIVGISHSAIASGRFVDTTIHELWHGLSQYLPDDTVNDLYKQYARERGKFMRDNPEAFDRSGELVDVTMAKNQSTYRFSSFDEWCVEKMKDLSIEDASSRLLERDKTLGYSDTAPGKAWERALRALADLVRGHYNQLKAIFGRDVARQTYTDFMGGKYMEQVRNTPLADVIKITPKDEAQAAQRWTSYLDALDADEGVEAAAQSMSEETERFIEQMVVGPAEVVTDAEFESLASQPPTPAAKTDTPEFKRWFGDSKVIDEAGKPLVVHHGTDAEPFEVFDRAKSGKGPSKVGFWFSDDAEFSSIYGKNVSVYLNIENPKKLTQDEWNDIREEHARDDEWFSSWRDGLIEQGYDGIIVESTTEKLGRFTVRNPGFYAAFEPTQIKSVENVGTFDPTDPSILKGIGLGAAALPAAGALMADDEDEVKDDKGS